MQFEICKSFKGHSNNRLNNEVDRLAVNAKNTARKPGKTIGFNGSIITWNQTDVNYE